MKSFTMKTQEIKSAGRRLIGCFHVRACGHLKVSGKFTMKS